MKRIHKVLAAVLMTVMIPVQVMADNIELTASNDKGEVKIGISTVEQTKSADVILPGIKSCKEAITNTLNIKTDAPASVILRLSASELPQVGANPLNNYEITVTDSENKVVYDSNTASAVTADAKSKDIELGDISAETEKRYTVKYKLIDSTIDVSKIAVELAVKASDAETPAPMKTSVPAKTPEPTLKPKFDFDSLDDATNEFVFDFDKEFGADEKTNTAQSEQTTQKEIKKICGKDIPAGRFSVTGNGKMTVTSANGSIKNSYIISDTAVGDKSVKTAVVLLEKDDVITINPLDGDEKAKLRFNKVATAASTATATPVKPSNTQKTNPKTGDGGLGIVVGVGIFAIAAFAGLELLKRKGKNNN